MAQPAQLAHLLEVFFSDAIVVLKRDHVLPRPRFQPWIEAGTDYYGGDLSSLQSFNQLEAAIAATDARFSEDASHQERDFANGYIFDALEFYVAQLTQGNPDALGATASALLAGLKDPRTMASAWMVTDITTEGRQPLDLAGVAVHRAPPVGAGARRAMSDLLCGIFSERAKRLDHDRLHHPFPEAGLLVATHEESGSPFGDGLDPPPSTRQVGDFVLAVRLLFGATAHPMYELRGNVAAIGSHQPFIHDFEGSGQGSMSAGLDARRAATIQPSHEAAIAEVMQLTRSVLDGEPSSLQTAIHRYQLSHHKSSWADKIIDLTIGLEAALGGSRRTEITFRLQLRAGAFLTADDDPADQLFEDVKRFYGLRSRFVHGTAMSGQSIEKELRKIHRIPSGTRFDRFRSNAVVDRLRDIVRRAILCRLLLAHHAPEIWPVDGRFDDASIVGNSKAETLREAWRRPLADLRFPQAAQPAPQLRRRDGST